MELHCADLATVCSSPQDGETDWKLRNAVRSTQALDSDEAVLSLRARVNIEAPRKEIYEFAANFTAFPGPRPPRHQLSDMLEDAPEQPAAEEETAQPLNLEHTLW